MSSNGEAAEGGVHWEAKALAARFACFRWEKLDLLTRSRS